MSISTETHDIGKFFWHTIRLEKGSAFIHRHPTHEIDPPFRFSNSVLFRLPLTTRGLVLGWWHTAQRTEEQAILAGMSGRELGNTIVSENQENSVRRLIDRKSTDTEDQIKLAQMMGVS